MDLISISQQGLGACWLSASAAGGGPTLPSAGRPAVCINLSSDPDAHLETARALSAALCLEIPAAYLVLRRGGLRMLYPCSKKFLGRFIPKTVLHWILNSRARSRVVGPSMWPRASEVLLVLNKMADSWGPHQTIGSEALRVGAQKSAFLAGSPVIVMYVEV